MYVIDDYLLTANIILYTCLSGPLCVDVVDLIM